MNRFNFLLNQKFLICCFFYKFETIWEYLPNANKLSDAELVFSTFTDGYSLGHLYQKCLKYADDSIIIIIKNNKNVIFGAFVDSALHVDPTILYRGTRDSFVFSLYPSEKKYDSTGFNNDFLRCETEYFSLGSEGFFFFFIQPIYY